MVSPANYRSGVVRRPAYFWLLILFAVLALATAVVTRTSVFTVSHGISVNDNSAGTVRQHMDSDGVPWVPPIITVIMASLVILAYPRIAPDGPLIPDLFYKETLYNRPPPTC